MIATGPGHGIRLSTGRLLVPVWLSTSTGDNAHHPSCASTIYSDDAGKTWSRGDIVANNSAETPDPSETAAAALPDGSAILNMRNESKKNRRLISSSPDGATHWSTPHFDEALFEPICFASLVAIPGKEPRLIFSNPDSSTSSVKTPWKPRQNLTIRLSTDGGLHWPTSRVLDPGLSGYSDLAAAPDGTLYCLYERAGLNNNIFHTQYLCLARFTLDWLTTPPPQP